MCWPALTRTLPPSREIRTSSSTDWRPRRPDQPCIVTPTVTPFPPRTLLSRSRAIIGLAGSSRPAGPAGASAPRSGPDAGGTKGGAEVEQVRVEVVHRDDLPTGLPALWELERIDPGNEAASACIRLLLRSDLPQALADFLPVHIRARFAALRGSRQHTVTFRSCDIRGLPRAVERQPGRVRQSRGGFSLGRCDYVRAGPGSPVGVPWSRTVPRRRGAVLVEGIRIPRRWTGSRPVSSPVPLSGYRISPERL